METKKMEFTIQNAENGYIVTDNDGKVHVSLTENYVSDCFRDYLVEMLKGKREWVIMVEAEEINPKSNF